MKRLFVIILLTLSIAYLIASDTTRFSKRSQATPDNSKLIVSNQQTRHESRNVPYWEFIILPRTLMYLTSYYDYMLSGYNDNPISYSDIGDEYSGYFLAWQGKATPSAKRRIYYGFISDNGEYDAEGLISLDNHFEGFPSLAIDPVSGKPMYAWHTGINETDEVYDVKFSYDTFFEGQSGLFTTPITLVNNPVTDTAFTNPPVITTDNEYLWPSVKIGPSPTPGMRRVYVLTKNFTAHINLPGTDPDPASENVRIDYADFSSTMMDNGAALVWHHTSIPLLDAWNTSIDGIFRRPHYAFTVGDDGKIYYIGYHTAEYAASGAPLLEPDMDAFVCDNYGQGTWQRYTASSAIPSWNPPTNNGQGTGYFKHNEIPYTDNQLFWKIAHSEHINAEYGSDDKIHVPAMWFLTNSDDSQYSDFNTIKEIVFDTITHQFTIREIYPIAGTSTDNICWQPWDMDGNNSVDFYNPDGNPFMKTDWNFSYWNNSLDVDDIMANYNNIKITKPNSHGWMACVWQNSWRAKQFLHEGNTAYQPYTTVPEIYISVSTDNGVNWKDPIIINPVANPQFSGNRPMWVYPANEIKYINNSYGELALMFYHDNTWGSYLADGAGINDGGNAKFMSIEIQPDVSNDGGLQGFVRDAFNNQLLGGVEVSAGNRSCYSNSQGFYSLTCNSGTTAVTFIKAGYNNQTIPSVYVPYGYYALLDGNLIPSWAFHTITGNVLSGNPPLPLVGATITLTGINNHTTITNSAGAFTINNVLQDNIYQYVVRKQGYSVVSGNITMGSIDIDMGNLTLQELMLPALNPSIEICGDNTYALVTWQSPLGIRAVRLTDKLMENKRHLIDRSIERYYIWRVISGSESDESSWVSLGSVPATALLFRDYSWNSLPEGIYRYAIKVKYSNDEYSTAAFTNGMYRHYRGRMSGIVKDYDNNIIESSIITLTRIVPNGYGPYTAISNSLGQYAIENVWNGLYIATCTSNGFHPHYQDDVIISANHTLNYNFNLVDSLFAPLSVSAVINQQNTLSNISWLPHQQGSVRSLKGYKLWRFVTGNEQNQLLWTSYPNLITNTNFVDSSWISLASGQYKYAVKAVMYINSGYFSSEPAFSNAVEKTVANIDETDNLPIDKLLGCYPNPFAISTQLTYSLKSACPVEIRIYNIHGQLVKTLTKQNPVKGLNTITWNAMNKAGQRVPSGIYFCKMKANGMESMQKVLLLK